MATILDKRLYAYRPDLAALALKDQVEATRYAEGVLHHVFAPLAPLRRAPAPDAPLDTEALMGEEVMVFEAEEGWAWAQLQRDGYVGYLPSEALGKGPAVATHRITALRSFVYPGPSIKLPPVATLSFAAEMAVKQEQGDFAVTAAGYVHAGHLTALGQHAADYVAEAERFVGTPYLWGGKSSLGLDCSALVVLSLGNAGKKALRDSDMQEGSLGQSIAFDHTLSGLKRGDLVFWKGHVGIMQSESQLLHANGHFMAVTSEPLKTANARITQKTGAGITSIRRM
jgi:cell wall-associated NlpC family hydrolase